MGITLRNSTGEARVFVSGMSLSSFDVSPSSGQLNGTWQIDFSLLYKDTKGSSFSCDSAAVSVHYKGAYLAGANLHTFRAPAQHPMPMEASVDASRSYVPGWLAHNLTQARRLGVVEFDVQFVAKQDTWHDSYLCGGLRLGFSTTEEAKLIGDGHIRCPLVA